MAKPLRFIKRVIDWVAKGAHEIVVEDPLELWSAAIRYWNEWIDYITNHTNLPNTNLSKYNPKIYKTINWIANETVKNYDYNDPVSEAAAWFVQWVDNADIVSLLKTWAKKWIKWLKWLKRIVF